MDSPVSKRSLTGVSDGNSRRIVPMISVLRTACNSAHSCIPGTDKEQEERVLEKRHTEEENAIYWIP